MLYALIPVKELSQAKTRLSPVLDAAGRRELTLAMLRDVLHAALACPTLTGVAVTTRDKSVLAIASEAGATPLPEPGGHSTSSGQALNEALTTAAERLRELGVTRLLVLAADLPLADAESIAAVAAADADLVAVPSRDGGTNALALTPGAVPFRFGAESARRHLAEAEAAGLRALGLQLPALALDIDTPDDLARLRRAIEGGARAGRATLAALERLGLLTASTRGG